MRRRVYTFFSAMVLVFVGQLLADEKEWRMVWEDDFLGEELDFTKWAVEENGHGGGNEELQYYLDRPKNVRVENGYLILEAHREPVDVAGVQKGYSSGRVRTKRRASWQYGRFEVRAQMPKGKGLWPAVWLLPEDERYGRWAASGEIDIVEIIGHDTRTVHGSLHFGDVWPRNAHETASFSGHGVDYSQGFHVFALEWEPEEIRWYVDGKLYHRFRNWSSTAAPYPAPFDQPFHLILNLAVGGRWPGNPERTTRFPAQFKVDWVRVYQKAPSPPQP